MVDAAGGRLFCVYDQTLSRLDGVSSPVATHSRLERNLRLGLAGAEVKVIEIVGNGLIERRQLRVDEQVVMTRIVMLQAGGRNSHAAQAEADGHLGRQLRAGARARRNAPQLLRARVSDRRLWFAAPSSRRTR